MSPGPVELSNEDFLREKQRLANCPKHPCLSINYRLHEICMVAANVVTLFYCSDSISRRLLPDIAWVNGLRVSFLLLLSAGTIVGNLFSKIPVLVEREKGLGLNKAQLKIYGAIERGVLQAQVFQRRQQISQLTLTAILLDDDYQKFSDLKREELCKLLMATYEIEVDVRLRSDGVDSLYFSNKVVLNVNDWGTVAGATNLYQSTQSICKRLKYQPGIVAVDAFNFAVVRVGCWLSIALSVNQSMHEVLKAWTPWGKDTHKLALVTVLIFGVFVAAVKANTNNKITCDNHNREVLRQLTACQLKLKPKINCVAFWLSSVLAAFSLLFNFNVSLFFGAGGVNTVWEEIDWLLNSNITGMGNTTAVRAPQALQNVTVGYLLVANLYTVLTTNYVESYRKIAEMCSKQKYVRQQDDTAKRYCCIYAVAVSAIILDSINYALVAANTADETWQSLTPLFPALPLTMAAIIFVVQTVVSVFWSLSTFGPTFSGTMHMFTYSCQQRQKALLEQEDSRTTALLEKSRFEV